MPVIRGSDTRFDDGSGLSGGVHGHSLTRQSASEHPAAVHYRMTVILGPDGYEPWLQGGAGAARGPCGRGAPDRAATDRRQGRRR